MAKPYDAQNVQAFSPKAKATGGVKAAPVGTALPTDTTGELDPAFVSLGYVAEDGVTEANSRDTEKVKAWGNQIVKIISTDHELSYSFSLLETTNGEAMKMVFGEDAVNVDDLTGEVTLKISAEELPEKSLVLDMYDKGTRVEKRVVIPRARVTELGDQVYAHGEVSMYEVTVECMEDDDQAKAYQYTKPPKAD